MPKGGRREKSGRKPGKHGVKQNITIRVTPAVWMFLKSVNSTPGEFVEAAVRKMPQFKSQEPKLAAAAAGRLAAAEGAES